MGSSYISGFTEILGDGDQALETAVRIQLTGNHYPPIHSSWIPVAIKAIKTVENDPEGDFGWDDLDRPEAFTRNGEKPKISVTEVMDGLHLWDLVRQQETDYDRKVHDDTPCDECGEKHDLENEVMSIKREAE